MTNVQLASHFMLYRDFNSPVSQISTFYLHLFPLSKTPSNNPFYLHKTCSGYTPLYLFRQDLLYHDTTFPLYHADISLAHVHPDFSLKSFPAKMLFTRWSSRYTGAPGLFLPGLLHLLNFLNSCWFISPSCQTPYKYQHDSIV